MKSSYYATFIASLLLHSSDSFTQPSAAFLGSRSNRRSASSSSSSSSTTTTSPASFALASIASRTNLEFSGEEDLPEGSSNHGRGISSSELRKMSEVRRRRLHEENERETRFVAGDELQQLRQQIYDLRTELNDARQTGAATRVRELERTILKAQQLDAEFIYQVALERMEAAAQAGLHMEAEKYRKEAQNAREAIPVMNLSGLWVGKYGEHGFEMVNVTYSGDTLIAYKVTGDRNVPKGEISFEVDLSPPEDMSVLEPIELGEQAAEQWGNRFLQRFAGEGQVASRGFKNPQWLEGQLILVGQYFSFAWLPIGHQVFFGRPSAELTLKLLRETRELETSEDHDREFLRRCFEETEFLEDELEVTDGVFQSNEQQDYFTQSGCFE